MAESKKPGDSGSAEGESKPESPLGALVRREQGGGGLARPGALPSALGRVAKGGDTSAVDRFKEAATGAQEAKLAGLAAQGREQALQVIFDREARRIERELRLELAVVLDLTASTQSDIAAFKADAAILREELGKMFPGGAQVLPAIFRGYEGVAGVSAYGETGPVGNLGWFDTIPNVTNHRNEPPVVAGLNAVVQNGFFGGQEGEDRVVRATVVMSDDGFAQDEGYEGVIDNFKRQRVALASLVQLNPHMDEQQAKPYLDTHRVGVVDPLKERGVVIRRGQTGEVDPVALTLEFIKNQAANQAKRAATKAPAVLAAKQQAGVSVKLNVPFLTLAAQLKEHGRAIDAGAVTQGDRLLEDGNGNGNK